MDAEHIKQWLHADESEHLDFKTAADSYSGEKLVKYCCAMANENGGRIIFGVTDRKPRQVVGTKAFENLNKIKQRLTSTLGLRIDVDEVRVDGKRVLVVTVPPRPIGVPKAHEGIYWMRRGEELVPMTADMLKRIFDEGEPDYSALICKGANLADLSTEAIEEFRKRWVVKSGNKTLVSLPAQQLLRDAELLEDNGITYAALVLLGSRAALGKLLAQAEVIFEYRSKESAGPAGQRVEFREGFFLYYEKLWELVDRRNEVQHFQDGLFMRDVPTFSEGSIREAILNAVSHRDYQNPGSVFIRQFPERIEITSPGGFPPGITQENIIDRQMPRNRRIAEAFARCGLVERSGQGANRIFEEAIGQGKALPDFHNTDEFQVSIVLDGRVRDASFLKFLEHASSRRDKSFSTYELLALEAVHKGVQIANYLSPVVQQLVEEGVVERVGRAKCILARKYYDIAGKKGVYTNRRGLDRETNRQLLLKHIRDNAEAGSRLNELMQVLPSLTRPQVQKLLRELKSRNIVYKTGTTRASLWFPAADGAKKVDDKNGLQ